MSNVHRHARAATVQVSLERSDGAVRLEIRDDGVGFDPHRLHEDTLRADPGRGMGLLGMRERIGIIGGDLAIESAPGQGATVRAHVPLPTP